jgi:arylformamidase
MRSRPRVFDLSDPIYQGMRGLPNGPEFSIRNLDKPDKYGTTMCFIPEMNMHTGTHVDAPLHFLQDGKSIDKYPIERFVGEGVVLDLRNRAGGEEITEADLLIFDENLAENGVILLCTDWSKTKTLSHDYPVSWPYLGPSACRLLVSRKVKAVGTEGPSISGWWGKVGGQRVSKYSPGEIHRMLLENDILVVENLFNLSQMLGTERVAKGLFFFAPLNIIGPEAGPCRAIALLDD